MKSRSFVSSVCAMLGIACGLNIRSASTVRGRPRNGVGLGLAYLDDMEHQRTTRLDSSHETRKHTAAGNPISQYIHYARELWKASPSEMIPAEASSPKKLRRRAATGVFLGATFSAWIFSSNIIFAILMFLQVVIAQLEYFRMAISTGATPARRIVLCSSFTMIAAACLAPGLHELVFPLAGTWIMLWLLLMRPNCSSINDISTTLMGLFYTAYLPSWWVRLRCSPAWDAALIAPSVGSTAAAFDLSAFAPAPLAPFITTNSLASVAVWWTCLAVAAADIGAYFGGKRFGRRNLKSIGLGAAAKASPNKTIEGALSGFAAAALVTSIAAYIMHWRLPFILGPAFGLAISMTALVGDLTASMLKRDSNIKDYGSFLPGHGGLLDRLDGFIFVAPLAFCLLPKLVLAAVV